MGKLAEAYVEISSEQRKLDEGLITAQAKLEQFVGRANSLLSAVGIGLGLGGMIKILSDMTMKGSDLIETMSKVEQVFGKASGTIAATAEDMATQFGSSKRAIMDAAAAFGLVIQGAGVSAEKSADLSTKLVRLADDASSFYNVPLGIALEKIRAGLVGEAEPLRAFGVMLSEDAVKAQALADGAKLVSGELSNQEKVMTRVKLITEGLAKATGDHARTLDQFANSLRRIKGEAENFEADIGSGVSAAVASFMSNMRNNGILSAIGQHIDNVWDAYSGVGPFQQGADVARGVQHGFTPAKPLETPFQRLMRERTELMREHERRNFEENKFTGGLPFGMMGMLPTQIMADAARRDAIRKMEAIQQGRPVMGMEPERSAWSGGHITTTESFMRQAQEKILEKKDTEQLAKLKEQIAILGRIQAATERMAATPGKSSGAIVKGREN